MSSFVPTNTSRPAIRDPVFLVREALCRKVAVHGKAVKEVCRELLQFVAQNPNLSRPLDKQSLDLIESDYVGMALVDLRYNILRGNDLLAAKCSLVQRLEGKDYMLDGCKARTGLAELEDEVDLLLHRDTAQYFYTLYPIMTRGQLPRLGLSLPEDDPDKSAQRRLGSARLADAGSACVLQ